MEKLIIYTLSINEVIDEAIIMKWLNYLAAEQRERLLRFRFREDFLRSLYGEAMLRIIVGGEAGVAPESIKIVRRKNEKPFLQDYPKLHFNISHSGEWVVCAIGDGEVGIDIEEIRDKELNSSLIRKVLTEREQEYFQRVAEEDKATIFYQFWTMKEAYCKCVGQGLRISFDKVDIDINRQKIYLIDEKREWDGRIKFIDFNDGYMMSVCVVRDFLAEIKIFNENLIIGV